MSMDTNKLRMELLTNQIKSYKTRNQIIPQLVSSVLIWLQNVSFEMSQS